MKNIFYFITLLSFNLLISSCRKDDDNSLIGGSGQSGQMITADFKGFVKDAQGSPLSGATVTAGNKTVMTNSSGGFKIQNASVNKSRAIIQVSKSGYLSQQKAIIPQTGYENYTALMLFSNDKAYTVNAVSGGMVSMAGGTTIAFPANAFVTGSGIVYSGTVYITAHEILTSDSSFSSKIPGGDLMARDSAGVETLLLSYGMAGAELYDAAGNSLQLASGKTAIIKFPISASQTGIAPATIPLWHYDESEKMWLEEGSANRIGNYYEGVVSHFSWWNCDQPCQMATLTISMTGCEGNPLINEILEIQWNGQSRSGSTYYSGSCTGLIPANAVLTVNCYSMTGILDTTFTIGTFSNQSIQNIQVSLPNVNCNSCQINLLDCNGFPTNGVVQLYSNGMLLNNVNTSFGSTTISGLGSGMYNVSAFSGQFSGSATFAISPSSSTNIILSITVCDSVANSGNGHFNLYTDFPTPNNRILTVLDCNVQGANIYFTCIDSSTLEEWDIFINNSTYAIGTYPWNFSFNYGVMMIKSGISTSTWTYHSINGSTVFTNTPPPGGNLTGSFSGVMNVEDSVGNLTPIQATASFEAFRM